MRPSPSKQTTATFSRGWYTYKSIGFLGDCLSTDPSYKITPSDGGLYSVATVGTNQTTVYVVAMFEEDHSKYYTVNLDYCGIGDPELGTACLVKEGDTFAAPDDPEADGYHFLGWYADPERTRFFDFDTPVTESITLYAKWSQLGVAAIGDTVYSTLQAAIDEAQSGDTVKLVSDVNECIELNAGKCVTLDLNGKVLTAAIPDSDSSLPTVSVSQSELTIIDSAPESAHRCCIDEYGMYSLDKNGDKTIKGGIITGGTGSGICLSGGSVTLISGNIAGNSSSDGGGVFVFEGTFTMAGGQICGNYATYGGISFCYDTARTFIMTGGKITENIALIAGGVELYEPDGLNFVVGGNAYIYGNTDVNGDDSNLFFHSNSIITVNSEAPLTDGAKIGVNLDTVVDTVITNPTDADYSEYFDCDDPTMTVVNAEEGDQQILKAVTTAFKFDAISLTLDGDLILIFYAYVNDTDAASDGYMKFVIGSKAEEQTVFLKDLTVENDGRYAFTCHLTPLQMNDTVTVSFHYDDTTSATKETSIAAYLNKLIDKYENDDGNVTVALAKAMLNYGHYAQQALKETHGFTLGTDGDYAGTDAICALAIPENPDLLIDYAASKAGTAGNIGKTSYSLSLESRTDINVYFRVNDAFTEPAVTVTDENGNSVFFTLTTNADGRYRLTIPNISAYKLADTYTVAVDDALTIRTSALSYAHSVLTSDRSDAQKLAVTALYHYCLAACNYKSVKS